MVQHPVVEDGKRQTGDDNIGDDNTDENAQISALALFGVRARLVQSTDFQMIEQQVNLGIPVPCGYRHRGPVGSAHRPGGLVDRLRPYPHPPRLRKLRPER